MPRNFYTLDKIHVKRHHIVTITTKNGDHDGYADNGQDSDESQKIYWTQVNLIYGSTTLWLADLSDVTLADEDPNSPDTTTWVQWASCNI